MNYIELINRFWSCSIERAFNPSDCMLYFYLLNTCNALHWKQPFGQSDRYLSVKLGISVNTIRDSKNRLSQMNLIQFKAPEKGSKGINGQTKYWFPATASNNDTVPETVALSVSMVDTDTDTVVDTVPDTVIDTDDDTVPDTNNKQNKNKRKKREETALNYPFTSERFMDMWNSLLEIPKWKKKIPHSLQLALNSLGNYEEEFAIELIEKSIEGNWQGVTFPNTPDDYEKWKRRRNESRRSFERKSHTSEHL
ncbi:hypothetical protein [Limibacterium fermenti]|uniref:hypothetical protein n=1 Tax=Limibacterium fermenti TaxID=3229863 RepID=UPI003A7A91C4